MKKYSNNDEKKSSKKDRSHKTKGAFIQLTAKDQLSKSPENPVIQKRRTGRIIMIVDLVLVALIFVYITQVTRQSPYKLGKPVSKRIENFQFRMNISFLKELNIFSVNVSVENMETGNHNPKKSRPGKEMSLILVLNKLIILKKTWGFTEEFQTTEVKLFRSEFSEQKIQEIFTLHPESIIKKKNDSLISFDSDKVQGTLKLHLDNREILSKMVLFNKR